MYTADGDDDTIGCRLIKEAVDKWGTIDILVNNAGITRDTLIMRMKPEQWQQVIDTNLTGVFYATQVQSRLILRLEIRLGLRVSRVVLENCPNLDFRTNGCEIHFQFDFL